MGKKKGVIIALLAAMTMLFMVACGEQEEMPADADTIASVEEVTGTEESEESQEATVEESSEAPEVEEVKLSGDYLAEIAEGEMLEFAYSDYNSDYVVGNKITISVSMESASGFNGSIGCCVGSGYDWKQEEFAFEAGSGTLTWTVTPSVDSAQLNLWWADGGSVGITAIDIAIEEVEPGVIGKVATLMAQDTFEFTFSEYNADYKVGDMVKVTAVLESDGDFNGAIGASVGKDYEWVQKDFNYDEAGTYTLEFTVKPSSDYSNIGIWWVGGTSVGLQSLKVEILEEEIGIHGDYIAMLTDEGSYDFVPSLINPAFKFGDTVRITVTLESDGDVTGCMGTCVGGNYEWKQTEFSSESGVSTWTLDIAPVIDSVQLGIWWIGGTAVGIVDIDVDILNWGYQHKEVNGLVYTSTSKGDTYTFKPTDYCDFEDGDIITILVELDSNDVYNGSLGLTDADGVYRSSTFSSNSGTVYCELVVKASTSQEAKIDFWWMNTKVAVNAITVTKGGTIVDTNDDDIYHVGEMTKYRTASDYCDYKQGDTITVTVTLSGDGYFNGALGMAGLEWVQGDFESADGSPVTCSITVPGVVYQERNIQINVWWSEGSYVKIDSITVTVGQTDSEDNEDDGQQDQESMDTSGWQLAFNGFTSGWGGWSSVEGETGKLEFTTTVKDIMAANGISSIDEFGGLILQIWHVDSKYNGRTFSYKLTINGETYKEGEMAINSNEYNSVSVIQIESTAVKEDGYAFSADDVVYGVIEVAAGGDDDKEEDPTTAVTIFEGGKTDESYESGDASWLLNANDSDIITIMYTCDTAANAGWGVVGWGADVDGEWKDGPGYSADGSNAAKEVTIKVTAAQLRAALGITEGSEVKSIKLGAWNGGRIISLTITEVKGEPEEPADDAIHTFSYEEWSEKQGTADTTIAWSFKPGDYGEYAEGDAITIKVTMESDGSYYNGTLGVGDADDVWVSCGQVDSSGSTWTLEVPKASATNEVQIQIWWMNDDATYVKVTDIQVEKAVDGPEEPDNPVNPDEPEDDAIHTFTYEDWSAAGNTASYDFKPSEYGTFETGDTIKITVTFEAEGDYYKGCIGVADASDTWTATAEQTIANSTWTLTVPNASVDNEAQIQIWWMNEGTTAKVTDIKVEKVAEESGPIYTFTNENYADGYSFNPSDYGSFETGDTITITVTLEAEAGDAGYCSYGGCVGVSDANADWKTGEGDNNSSQWTVTLENASVENEAQIQMWWFTDGNIVKVTDIQVQKAEEVGPIYTFTNENYADGYSFNPSDYGSFETGDTITITVTLEAEAGDAGYCSYGGCVGVSDANADWKTGEGDNNSSQWTVTLENASVENEAQIQMWWFADGNIVKVTDIQVQKAEEVGPIYTFTNENYADGYSFNPSDYGSFETGDTITITVTLEAEAGDAGYCSYGGCVGVSDANADWKTGEGDNNSSQWAVTLENASVENGAQIQMWWFTDGNTVNVTDIQVEKSEATAGIAKANILAASGMEGKNTIPASVSGNGADGAATVSGGDAADAESEEDNVVTVSGNDAANAD